MKESVAEQAYFNVVCERTRYSSVLRKLKKAPRFPQSVLHKRIRQMCWYILALNLKRDFSEKYFRAS